MICVPVDVPSSYVRYLRSAASRSFGPNEEEKSGVDFTMRTIGRRFERKPKEEEDEVDGDEEDDEGAGDHEDLGVEDAVEEDMLMEAADPHMMTARQLKATFKDNAMEMQSVLFQHSTRITAFASFLGNGSMIKAL